MEDRYLFRGKIADDDGEKMEGAWVTGFLFVGPYLSFISCWKDGLGRKSHRVDPKTVGQCTGQRDRNGKLIFAGDRLSDGEAAFIVFWDRYRWAVRLSGSAIAEDGLDLWSEDCSVAGNIHDDPELAEPKIPGEERKRCGAGDD